MVDKVEVTVTNLEKKHKGKSGYEGMYSITKHVYREDGRVDTIGFAIDKVSRSFSIGFYMINLDISLCVF